LADRDEDGLPLGEALRAFADPDKWREYEAASVAAAGKVRRRLMYVGGEPIAGWGAAEQARHDNRLLDRRDQIRRALVHDLVARLRSGELIAAGYEEPLSLGSTRRPIAAELWQILRPNFKTSAAAGAGLTISGILVRCAGGKPEGPVGSGDRGDFETIPQVRPPGRPSIMPEIEAEMRRRAAAGQLLRSLRAESEALAAWASANHPDRAPPMARSIARRLASVYRELTDK
jgi:hypothetical protein